MEAGAALERDTVSFMPEYQLGYGLKTLGGEEPELCADEVDRFLSKLPLKLRQEAMRTPVILCSALQRARMALAHEILEKGSVLDQFGEKSRTTW